MNQLTTQQAATVVSTENQATHGLVLFMTGELLPDMIFNWPNGANRIEQNLQGAAQSYARQLVGRGFTTGLIRKALQAEIDSDRDFMPTPRELAARCQALYGNCSQPSAASVSVISPAAVKMIAASRLWCGGRDVNGVAVEHESALIAGAYKAKGVQVAGGDW